MPKMEVVSHEYDENTGIDKYVFNPGNLEALVKIVEEDGSPKVLLGVQAMAVQQDVTEPTWTVCPNPAITEIALATWEARQK